MKSLTQDELMKVLRVASSDPRDHAMVLLAFRHGMRASEVCELKLSDVDLKNNEIVIRRLKGSLKTTQPLADVAGEPLLSERKVLKRWLEARSAYATAKYSEYVFVSQKSKHVERKSFHRLFADIAERAGIDRKRCHPHVLKHSLGVLLVEANVNLAVVKQALGHKSIASTAIYTVPSDESAGRAVVAALASL